MALPRGFWRVEWQAARAYDRPADRTPQARNFTSPEGAARQVRSLRSWPTHVTVIGVWYTPATWETVDGLLPAPPEIEVHYHLADLARAGVDPSELHAVAELIGTDQEGTET